MKRLLSISSIFCLFIITVNAQLIERDFLSGYSIGDDLEKGSYPTTNENELSAQEKEIFQNIWLTKFESKGSNSKITTPLVYKNYIESGKGFAFEVSKSNSGARTIGYSFSKTSEHNSGTYYLAFMIKINDDLTINTIDRTRNMIGFCTKQTLDLSRVVLSVSKAGISNNSFKFGIGEKHSAAAGNYPMAWSSKTYNFNETYLAVLKYDFSTKKASLFINPKIRKKEPSSLVQIKISDRVAKGIAKRGFRAICLEQGRFDSRIIGGIRLAKDWTSAIGLED